MPPCSKCKWLKCEDDSPCCGLLGIKRKTPTRACSYAIMLKHSPNMKGEVLEVGCGVWKHPRRIISRTAKWWGLDPRWPSHGNFVQGTVGKIPLASDRFDWVVAIATVEHWVDYGESVSGGLREIHRVLKPGGRLLLTAPMHVHGADLFSYGMVTELKHLVSRIGWKRIVYDEWRRGFHPLPSYVPFNSTRFRKFQQRRHPLYLMWVRQYKTLEDVYGEDIPSSWVLEVLATK